MSDLPPERIGLISNYLGQWTLAANARSKIAVRYVRADTVQAPQPHDWNRFKADIRKAALEDAASEVLKLITGHKKSTLADAHAAILALIRKGEQP